MKFCPKAGANLLSPTCELLQGKNISSDHQNNITFESMDGDIILDCWIKNHDGWVSIVKFLWETSDKRAKFPLARKISMTSMLNLIIHLSLLPMSLLKPWVYKSPAPSDHVKIALWAKSNNKQWAKGYCLIKKFGERLFFNISSPSTPTFGSKKHWLLVIDDISNFLKVSFWKRIPI